MRICLQRFLFLFLACVLIPIMFGCAESDESRESVETTIVISKTEVLVNGKNVADLMCRVGREPCTPALLAERSRCSEDCEKVTIALDAHWRARFSLFGSSLYIGGLNRALYELSERHLNSDSPEAKRQVRVVLDPDVSFELLHGVLQSLSRASPKHVGPLRCLRAQGVPETVTLSSLGAGSEDANTLSVKLPQNCRLCPEKPLRRYRAILNVYEGGIELWRQGLDECRPFTRPEFPPPESMGRGSLAFEMAEHGRDEKSGARINPLPELMTAIACDIRKGCDSNKLIKKMAELTSQDTFHEWLHLSVTPSIRWESLSRLMNEISGEVGHFKGVVMTY